VFLSTIDILSTGPSIISVGTSTSSCPLIITVGPSIISIGLSDSFYQSIIAAVPSTISVGLEEVEMQAEMMEGPEGVDGADVSPSNSSCPSITHPSSPSAPYPLVHICWSGGVRGAFGDDREGPINHLRQSHTGIIHYLRQPHHLHSLCGQEEFQGPMQIMEGGHSSSLGQKF
jgi:hypothetical protein